MSSMLVALLFWISSDTLCSLTKNLRPLKPTVFLMLFICPVFPFFFFAFYWNIFSYFRLISPVSWPATLWGRFQGSCSAEALTPTPHSDVVKLFWDLGPCRTFCSLCSMWEKAGLAGLLPSRASLPICEHRPGEREREASLCPRPGARHISLLESTEPLATLLLSEVWATAPSSRISWSHVCFTAFSTKSKEQMVPC